MELSKKQIKELAEVLKYSIHKSHKVQFNMIASGIMRFCKRHKENFDEDEFIRFVKK